MRGGGNGALWGRLEPGLCVGVGGGDGGRRSTAGRDGGEEEGDGDATAQPRVG